MGRKAPDLSDVIAVRDENRPWFMILWERLPTSAPKEAQPYCCYICTTIFYKVGPDDRYVIAANGELEQWDQIESRLSWGMEFRVGADIFEYGGGRIVWHDGWWHRAWARRRKTP